jgi:hypothetical protein
MPASSALIAFALARLRGVAVAVVRRSAAAEREALVVDQDVDEVVGGVLRGLAPAVDASAEVVRCGAGEGHALSIERGADGDGPGLPV